MSVEAMIAAAESLVKGEKVRLRAMPFHEWAICIQTIRESKQQLSNQ